jgi:hypothetical protein
MATTITLQHYGDTNTAADSPALSMPITNATGRVIGVTHPKSVSYQAILHSVEVTVIPDTDMVGCEILALGYMVKNVRQDLI